MSDVKPRFVSVLFPEPAQSTETEVASVPACSADLDFDQIVSAVVGGDEYRLRPFFRLPLPSTDAVVYRHEVFADLDGTPLSGGVLTFADQMRSVRQVLGQAEKMRHRYQRRTWQLTAAVTYVEAVTRLLGDLEAAPVTSRAMERFREALRRYLGSEEFEALRQDVAAAREAISDVRYTLLLYGRIIRVQRFDREADYGAEISSFFSRFRQGDQVEHQRFEVTDRPVMNRLEEQVLDRVVALFPEAFGALDRFCETHPAWMDALVTRFDREVQFYLAYLEVVGTLRAAGLPVCYPEVSSSKTEAASSTYDLALALRSLSAAGGLLDPGTVVPNDYRLSGDERIVVVTGPNHGGKTTFARAFGQLHWLAALGCPVPGTEARLFLSDRVLSHFGRGENLADMHGRLEDDLLRIHEVLSQATDASVVILNEVFVSTTLRDATVLSRAVLGALSELGALSLCVTFLDELASFDDKTVSMVAGVDPADPTVRTFKLERRPADGRAYAVVLAERYGLSHQRVKDRLAR